MPPPYARSSALLSLRLDLLSMERSIQKGYSYAYDEGLREDLRVAAIDQTNLLAEELNSPLVPSLETRSAFSEAMDVDLLLPGRLLRFDSLSWRESGLLTVALSIFGAGTDRIIRHGRQRGMFDATGVWGVSVQGGPVGIGTTVTSTSETVAGGSTPGWDVSRCSGGELFGWLGDDGQYRVVCLGAGRKIDSWWAPEVAIPSGTDLTYLGRLSPAVERYVMLGAYYRTWQATTATPEPDLVASESSGKHSYSADRSRAQAAASYQTEMAELRARIWTAIAPERTRLGVR